MYHQQGKNSFSPSRMFIRPERHIFLQGANAHGDTGLVLSTDAKPRLKWTPELHERFIDSVNQLGGADKATPKTVMKLMGIPGLTLYHLKSHLQKYRLSKNIHRQDNMGNSKNGVVAADRISEVCGAFVPNSNFGSPTNNGLQISEALQVQIEVQRRLHEQLEVQRHLQLRIEAQGKYLQSVLEKAQETLERQTPGSAGIQDAKEQLSELVSKVSNECLTSAFSGLKEPAVLSNHQTQTTPPTDCSLDSCLTSCEGSHKDQDRHNTGIRLRPSKSSGREETEFERTESIWCKDLNEHKLFATSTRSDTDAMMMFSTQSSSNKLENKKMLELFGVPYETSKLDLNFQDEDDAPSNCREFDLNGFSLS